MRIDTLEGRQITFLMVEFYFLVCDDLLHLRLLLIQFSLELSLRKAV